MKKIQNLGRTLNKDEQRKIIGGNQMTCTCNDHYTMGIVCSYSNWQGATVCTARAYQICTANGGTAVTCNYNK